MDEVGRELKASELVPRTVVVVQPPASNLFMTMWVTNAEDGLVVFHAGELNWSVINYARPDGTIWDDHGRQVHVFEFLGEV